jgi:hypothetical protein
MNEGQELVEAKETGIKPFSVFDQELADFKEMNSKMKFDIETYEGETDCKKYLARVGKMRIGVEKLRKSTKKEFLDKGNAVDDEAKVYQAEIAAIDAVHSVPLKALENKRINEALAEQEAIKAKEREAEKARLADLEEREANMAAKEAEQQAKDDAAQAERDATERKEELEAAALLAAETATLQAAQDAIDAEVKAKQDVLDAIAETERKAEAEADRLAKEVADKYEAQQAEQDEIDAAILARQQDEEHRKEFNNLALDAIIAVTGDPATSLRLVKAIVKGEIPNVTMNY